MVDLRQAFDAQEREFTVGVEEELLILDAGTLDIAPVCETLLAAAPGDGRFCCELPAGQVELVTPVCTTAEGIRAALLSARRDLLAVAGPALRLAGSGTHPVAAAETPMSDATRYRAIAAEYQWAARRGLCFGVHVHVAIRGADRALTIHDALRSYLPLLAALAGNAPFHDGRDTGLHSVRPKLCEGFPRQGIPPAWGHWGAFEEMLRWGAREGAFAADGRQCWWEARLHPGFGTLEVRVCDQPATAAESAALAAVVQALVAMLGAAHDAGVLPPPAPRERIEENRWRALRHGTRGTLLDLDSGTARPTAELIADLLTGLAPYARELGSGGALGHAWNLLACSGAARQRAIAAETGDLHAVVAAAAHRLECEVASADAVADHTARSGAGRGLAHAHGVPSA